MGDGAQWIADQVEDQFGAQGSYLLDFYHVCDYLSAAAKVIETEAEAQTAWMEEQKNRLKTQRAEQVLQTLQPDASNLTTKARLRVAYRLDREK